MAPTSTNKTWATDAAVWRCPFTISLLSPEAQGVSGDNESTADAERVIVPDKLIASFSNDGFVVLPSVVDLTDVQRLKERLDQVLRGQYDRGQPPDKTPPVPSLLVSDSGAKKAQVLQVINIHKADSLYRQLACHTVLAQVVAQLAGWTTHGCRLAQDQVWAKPPGAPPLTFHRDSPYFMFEPDEVITVWLALDDMSAELGPLEYVRHSHRWGEGKVGLSSNFFLKDGGRSLVRAAAAQAGRSEPDDLEFVSLAGLPAGSLAIHHGRTWHGSGKNTSPDQPRRGVGLHYVPADVQFKEEARLSPRWRPYLAEAAEARQVVLPSEDFPLVWQPPAKKIVVEDAQEWTDE